MPNANFQPLIGGSFENLGSQSAFWSGFNSQIENQNLARQHQAQQEANQYAMQVSEAQRADAARQAQLDQQSTLASLEHGNRLQNQARQDYQFAVGAGIQKRGQDINEARYKFADDFKTKQDKDVLNTVEKTAKFLAPDVNDYGSKVEDSQKTYADAMQRMTTLASELEKTLTPGKQVYNPHVNEFIPVPNAIPSADDSKKMSEANAKIANAKAIYEAAATTYQTHLNAFDTLRKQAYQNGLQISKRDGKWIVYSPNHDKTYGLDVPAPLIANSTATGTNPPSKPPYQWQPNEFSQYNDAHPTSAVGALFDSANYKWGADAPDASGPIPSNRTPANPAVSPTPSSAVPTRSAIEYLLQHPEMKQFFDAKYGAGTADNFLGAGISQPVESGPSMMDAARGAGSYIWNSGPVQGVRNFFKPGQPDPALQDWIHDAPAQ